MSLNIKDPEAYRLAQAIAAQTGESMTRAVVAALQERAERLTRLRQKPSVKELMEITRSYRSKMTGPPIDIDELLYDKRGLPRED